MASLAHYNLGEHVGKDRISDVYRATDTALGRTVTVKILRDEVAADAPRREALMESARRALSLSHPNIAALFQVGEENGKHFLVFEHAVGQTIRASVAGCPMNVRRAVDLGAQIADALADAHAQGFVHASLNPESIVLTQTGRLKILGFGVPAGVSDLTTPDEVECLAPERVLGEGGDQRADVFSLGCILFEMLTGTQPFAAATASDTGVAVLSRTPPPPSQLNAAVPEALDRVVERCLAKSVDRRCESAATVAAGLREVADRLQADERTDVPLAQFAQPPARRRTWLVVLLILLALAGVSAGALWLFK
jgi:serine/threonine-protein kinase